MLTLVLFEIDDMGRLNMQRWINSVGYYIYIEFLNPAMHILTNNSMTQLILWLCVRDVRIYMEDQEHIERITILECFATKCENNIIYNMGT